MGLLLPHGRCDWRDGAAFPLTEAAIRGHMIFLGLIAALVTLDAALNQSAASLFLIHEVMGLAQYLSFWRH